MLDFELFRQKYYFTCWVTMFILFVITGTMIGWYAFFLVVCHVGGFCQNRAENPLDIDVFFLKADFYP
jgi:hypothetical protein